MALIGYGGYGKGDYFWQPHGDFYYGPAMAWHPDFYGYGPYDYGKGTGSAAAGKSLGKGQGEQNRTFCDV